MGTRRTTVSLLLMSGVACIKEPWRTRNLAPRDAGPGALHAIAATQLDAVSKVRVGAVFPDSSVIRQKAVLRLRREHVCVK